MVWYLANLYVILLADVYYLVTAEFYSRYIWWLYLVLYLITFVVIGIKAKKKHKRALSKDSDYTTWYCKLLCVHIQIDDFP